MLFDVIRRTTMMWCMRWFLMCDSCWMILMSIIRGGTACLQPPATSNATIYFTCITCSIHLNSLWQTCSMAVPFSTAPQEHGQGWLLQRTLTLLNACHVVVPTALGTVITHFQQLYLLHNPNRFPSNLDLWCRDSRFEQWQRRPKCFSVPPLTFRNNWKPLRMYNGAFCGNPLRRHSELAMSSCPRFEAVTIHPVSSMMKDMKSTPISLRPCPTMIIGQWAVWRCFRGSLLCHMYCPVSSVHLNTIETLVRPARSLRS